MEGGLPPVGVEMGKSLKSYISRGILFDLLVLQKGHESFVGGFSSSNQRTWGREEFVLVLNHVPR